MQFGIRNILPLYRDNGSSLSDCKEVGNYLAAYDLKHIILSLLSKAKRGGRSLEEASWLAILSDAIGRGGEIRLQNFLQWEWHPHLQLTNTPWTEMKTLSRYAMGMIGNENWIFDFYHRIGCYFAFEDGLSRDEAEIKKGLHYTVFPNLHLMKLSSVTTLITNIIRDNLPEECPREMKMSFSAKSCRHGAITECANMGHLTIFDVCGRSGHSTGTTVDSYYDKNNPITGLRAAKARNGYSNTDSKIVLPELEAIKIGEPILKRLMEAVFKVSIPLFFEDGLLFPILRNCLASLILHHREVTHELGATHYIVSSLQKKFREAKVYDPRFPNHSPEAILIKWSNMIKEDMHRRKCDVLDVTPDIVSVAAGLNSALKMMITMKTDISTLVRKQNDLELQVAILESENGQLRQNEDKLKKQALFHRDRWEASRVVLRQTLESPLAASTNELLEEMHTDGSSPIFQSKTARVTTTSSTKSQGTSSAKRLFAWNNDGENRSLQKKSKASENTLLKIILIQLSESGTLNAIDLSQSTLQPGFVNEKAILMYCLELAQFVLSQPDQTANMSRTSIKNDLVSKESSHRDRQQAASTLVTLCMDMLDEFEEVPLAERKSSRKRRVAPTYIGIGGRVKKHKTRLMSLRGIKVEYDQQPLMLASEITVKAPGTPTDTRSMMNYITASRNI